MSSKGWVVGCVFISNTLTLMRAIGLIGNMLIRGVLVRGVLIWAAQRSINAAVDIRLAGCARAMRQCLAVHARASGIIKLIDGALLVAASARSAWWPRTRDSVSAAAKGDFASIAFNLSTGHLDDCLPRNLDGEVIVGGRRLSGVASSVASPVVALVMASAAPGGSAAGQLSTLGCLAQRLSSQGHRCASADILLVPQSIKVPVVFLKTSTAKRIMRPRPIHGPATAPVAGGDNVIAVLIVCDRVAASRPSKGIAALVGGNFLVEIYLIAQVLVVFEAMRVHEANRPPVGWRRSLLSRS